MTAVIALATKEWVILTADSAVTHKQTPVSPLSSMGEHSNTAEGIEEDALKIIPLGPCAAAGVSGNADLAIEALQWFRPHVQANDLVAAWAGAMSSKENEYYDFELFIARFHQGAIELYLCNPRSAEKQRLGYPKIIGSMDKSEQQVVATRVRQLLSRKREPAMFQLATCALFAWRAFNETPFKDGIGGAPTSICIDKNSLRWMPDASIYSIMPSVGLDDTRILPDQVHRISIMGRDQFVAVASTHTNCTRVLSNPLTKDKLDLWYQKWANESVEVAQQNNVQLVALITIVDDRAALLDRRVCEDKFLFIDHSEIRLGAELRAFLTAPPGPRKSFFTIPLEDSAALDLITRGGPVDDYELELCCWCMAVESSQGRIEISRTIWDTLIQKHPLDVRVLHSGIGSLVLNEDHERSECVVRAWERTLVERPDLMDEGLAAVRMLDGFPAFASRIQRACDEAGRFRLREDSSHG